MKTKPRPHRYGTPCLEKANRDAPCLLCGGCLTCCGCKDKFPHTEMAMNEKKPDAAWTCPKCGVVTEFEMGHVMAGCERKGA